MPVAHDLRVDQTVPLFLEGYGWLPNRRRRSSDGVVECRLMGLPVTGLCGPDAARFFYDEEHIRRHGALPPPVLSARPRGRRAVNADVIRPRAPADRTP
jgi:fatty-acid peroxygenase